MFQLKIVSYNIDNSVKTDLIVKNILELSAKGANIFCLQEVRPVKEGRFIGDIILEKLGSDWQAEFFMTAGYSHFDNGLGFVWNKKQVTADKFETISFTKLNKLDVHEQVFEYVKGSVKQPIQRAGLIGHFTIQNQPVRISNVHLDWHGWSTHRMNQLAELLRHLKKAPLGREVICGDFNTIGFFGLGGKLPTMKTLLGDEFVACFPKFVMTTSHFQHLDHIFVRNLKIKH